MIPAKYRCRRVLTSALTVTPSFQLFHQLHTSSTGTTGDSVTAQPPVIMTSYKAELTATVTLSPLLQMCHRHSCLPVPPAECLPVKT